MALDPQLLEILACPEDKGPLLYFADEAVLYNPRLQRRYADPRRHPGDADRRGRPRSTTPSTTAWSPRPRPTASSRRSPTADRPGTAIDARRQPRHVRRCLRRCPSRSRRPPAAADAVERPARRTTASPSVVVLGMGGSGIAGDVPAAVAAPSCPVPVVVAQALRVPGLRRSRHAGDRHLLLRQHRGDDRRRAPGRRRSGARLVAITSGGAAGRSWPATWGAAAWCGSTPRSRCPVPASARSPCRRWWCSSGWACSPAPGSRSTQRSSSCARRAAELGGRPGNPADRARPSHRPDAARSSTAAAALGEVGGVAVEGPVQREPQGRLRSPTGCPSSTHNEICGWGQHGDVTRQVFSLVLLRHDFEHPQVQRRFELIAEICDEVVDDVIDGAAPRATARWPS